MTTWPTFKSSSVLRGLQRAGFAIVRQKGSHARLEHQDGRTVTVPVHPSQDIAQGLLRKILRDAEMSLDEFREFT